MRYERTLDVEFKLQANSPEYAAKQQSALAGEIADALAGGDSPTRIRNQLLSIPLGGTTSVDDQLLKLYAREWFGAVEAAVDELLADQLQMGDVQPNWREEAMRLGATAYERPDWKFRVTMAPGTDAEYTRNVRPKFEMPSHRQGGFNDECVMAMDRDRLTWDSWRHAQADTRVEDFVVRRIDGPNWSTADLVNDAATVMRKVAELQVSDDLIHSATAVVVVASMDQDVAERYASELGDAIAHRGLRNDQNTPPWVRVDMEKHQLRQRAKHGRTLAHGQDASVQSAIEPADHDARRASLYAPPHVQHPGQITASRLR